MKCITMYDMLYDRYNQSPHAHVQSEQAQTIQLQLTQQATANKHQ